MKMKTKVIIKCEVSIDMGEVGGYHANDDIDRLKKAFEPKAMDLLVKALDASSIENVHLHVSNPKFTLIIEDT